MEGEASMSTDQEVLLDREQDVKRKMDRKEGEPTAAFVLYLGYIA